jgi:hypothetical protein
MPIERGCSERRYAGCYRGRAECGDALTVGKSADGACWLFSSRRQPSGFNGGDAY